MGNLLILAASSGKNLDLAMSIQAVAESMKHSVEVIDICGLNLPLYTPDTEDEFKGLEHIETCMARILSCDGMIVCAPEYNGLIPPVLNNLVAWISVQSSNFRLMFNKRNVGLASVSGGGGHQAILSMRMQFSYLGSNVLGRSITVNKNKTLNSESVTEMIKGVLR
jgi:NAD(P)H-dependent FMN reductase|tara:strand:- start:1511 stop:2008 length:498 start_codon:yes stop_codon:yes gene_type:complete